MLKSWNIFDNIVEGIQILDFEWKYLYVNNAWAAVSHTSKEDLLGKSFTTTFPKISETDFFAELQSCMRERVSKQIEVQFPFSEGHQAFDFKLEPIPEGVFMLSVKKIEQNSKKVELLQPDLKELLEYKFALDESAIVAITNSKGIIKHANKNFCQISKYSKEELIGQDHRIINSGYHSKDFIREVWHTISSGKIWKGEFKNKAKDGTYYWVDTTIVPFLDENKKPYQYLAIRADITQRKIAQESHFRIEKRLKESQEIAKLGNWEMNFSSGKVQLSEEACRIFGIEITESQLNYSDWLSYIHPEDLEYVLAINEEARTSASDVELQHRIVLKSGVVKHVYSKSKFEFDVNRKISGVYGIVHDITERQIAQTELVFKNEELEKTNEELDRFVYSASHDLRSPLTSILGLLSFIELESKEPETLNYAKMIRSSILRLDRFIKNILSYSRNNRTNIHIEHIPVLTTVNEVVDSLVTANEVKGIHFYLDIEEKEFFYSDKQRFEIVLENIISNSIKFHKEDGQQNFIKITGNVHKGKLYLTLEDNGTGIPAEYQGKIYDMFFRLSTRSNGAGIGLYIVKEIVKKLHGTIQVSSEEGKGTIFELALDSLKNDAN